MLLHYISYAAILAAFAFVTLSLASGLLYISELIEERSRLAKVVGTRGIYAIIVLHVLLYFFDSLPFRHTLFSILCHIVYLQNFSNTWPIISLTSVSFIASCVMAVIDHFAWFFYFAHVSEEAKRSTQRSYLPHSTENLRGFSEIATFFGICIWLAPLFLFLSLSANDNALPMSAAIVSETDNPMAPSTHSRASLFKSLFSSLSVEFPRIRPRASRKDASEGLIAPRTPLPVPPRSPSIYRAGSISTTSPPRSPGFQGYLNGLDVHQSSNSFKLATPPKRTSLHSVRRSTGEGIGLGLRKSTLVVNDDDDTT